MSLVPTQVRHLLDEPGGRDVLAGFRAILLGGAAAPAGLRAEAAAAGARVITTYGMSETCGGCVYDGSPLDGVSVRIGPGGRIELAGPVLFSGYRGRPDLTAAALDGGWFVTSDVGEVDASGRLAVRGRADGMINTGGEKVAADEVASVLEACPGVREAVVVGRPDPEWGEVVTAIVVPARPGGPPGPGRAARVRPRPAAGLCGAAGGRGRAGRPVAGLGQARPAGAEVAGPRRPGRGGSTGLGPGRTKAAPPAAFSFRGSMRARHGAGESGRSTACVRARCYLRAGTVRQRTGTRREHLAPSGVNT